MSYFLPILRMILLGLVVSLGLGWSGLAQAETCFGLVDTDPNVCSGAGSCVGPDLCACNIGYMGSQCDAWTCGGLTNTDPNVCSGNGICAAPDACACDVGYVGSECEFSSVPATSPLGLMLIMSLLMMASAVAIRRRLRSD